MNTNHVVIAAAIATTTFLSGCASPSQQAGTPTYPVSSSSNATYYGVVDSIQASPARPGSGIGAGAVLGGVVGGLLGNQVGGGDGKKIATVAGVVGGAVVGNQIEQGNQAQAPSMYRISVRLDNGGYQTIEQESVGDLRAGVRARIQNDRVYRY